jgi:hypothetical protein
VAVVALVAALAIALAELWQQWVRQQSTKKTTIIYQWERQRWVVAGERASMTTQPQQKTMMNNKSV